MVKMNEPTDLKETYTGHTSVCVQKVIQSGQFIIEENIFHYEN